MIGNFFGPKEHQTYNLGYCKLFDTKYNSIPCTKLTFKIGSSGKYEILKSLSHPNLLPVFKVSQHSVYTRRIMPLTPFIDTAKKEYNRYVVLKIKDALEYIHSTLRREHRGVSVETVFLDESGKVFLGGLERSTDFESTAIDDEMCNSLSIKIAGTSIAELDTDTESIFDLIFTSLDLSSIRLPSDKVATFCRILQSKEELPFVTIKFIFKIFIEDLRKEGEKEYKIFVLDSLYDLDKDYFSDVRRDMFSVIDSNVRMYLLKKFAHQGCSFDEISEDLSLGLRVKDKTLKKETLAFIFNNSMQFSDKSMGFLIESMQACTDVESINLICTYLLDLGREDMCKQIYRLILSFLSLGKNTLPVYMCIDRYFVYFDKFKIAKDILPNLCAKLIEKENQEYCFSLVERIINFLKEHKDEMNTKDWSFRNITSMFGKKMESDSLEDKVSKICKEELSDWDEKDI